MNQKHRIIEWLRERGSVGVNNYEFPQRYILNYKARLDELREEGYNIKTIKVEGNVWRYVLNGRIEKKGSWQQRRKKEELKDMEDQGQQVLL